MKAKYNFGSLKRLLCPNNNDTNFIANFKQIMEILRKTHEAVAALQPFSGRVFMTSHGLVCAIGVRGPKRPVRNMTARM